MCESYKDFDVKSSLKLFRKTVLTSWASYIAVRHTGTKLSFTKLQKKPTFFHKGRIITGKTLLNKQTAEVESCAPKIPDAETNQRSLLNRAASMYYKRVVAKMADVESNAAKAKGGGGRLLGALSKQPWNVWDLVCVCHLVERGWVSTQFLFIDCTVLKLWVFVHVSLSFLSALLHPFGFYGSVQAKIGRLLFKFLTFQKPLSYDYRCRHLYFVVY